MKQVKYVLDSFSWIGPDVDILDDTDIVEKHTHDNPRKDDSENKYVIHTTYLTLNPHIIGPVRTYLGCFKFILTVARTELRVAKMFGYDPVHTIRTVINNHKIIIFK